MKSHQVKFPVVLLAISLTVFGLSNCGQEKSASNADASMDTAKQEAIVITDTTDSQAVLLANNDKVEPAVIKEIEVKAEAKKVTIPVAKSPAKQIVVITKKPAAATPASKPVTPAPVVKTPEPEKPAPAPTPKPVEAPKPAPVAAPKPDADSWVVPAKYKSMTSPYPNNSASIAMGKSLFSTHCKSCHGSKGEGNGTKAASLDTKIRSFLSSGFKAQNQGMVYYKSMVGRDDMPRFEKKLPDDEEQWALVHYVMSL